MDLEGKCLCGSVTVKAKKVDPHMAACHCSMCRRWAGGPAFACAADHIVLTGDDLGAYAASEWLERLFCKNCGCHIAFRETASGRTMPMPGIFDDQSGFTLNGEIYIDNKPDGYAFSGNHRRETEQEFLTRIGVLPPGDTA